MILSFYYSQLQFYNAKLLDMPKEDHQVLGFVNPDVDPDDEDDIIIKQERSFSGAFNTFVNYWYVKKDKNILKLAFRLHAFPEIHEKLWKRKFAHGKFNF